MFNAFIIQEGLDTRAYCIDAYIRYTAGARFTRRHEITAEKDVGKTMFDVMSSMLNKSFVSRCTNCALINIHGADSGIVEKTDVNKNAAKSLLSFGFTANKRPKEI